MRKTGWRCPSNIALVKYWGKKEGQIPCNASVSMTLQNAYTETVVELVEKTRVGIEISYLFDNKPNPSFQKRVLDYLHQTREYFPIVFEYGLRISSSNSFPHSAGIASSASAFGALSLCLLQLSGYKKEDFNKKASYLARIGSGSASRSVFGGYNLWGKLKDFPGSSDEFSVQLNKIHQDFQDMKDAIIIVDERPKEVSSSIGHGLMKDHRYADIRYKQANDHASQMIKILESGDFQQFSSIIEQEALALHAMMMTSAEAYMLLKPGTIQVIEEIRKLRKENNLKVCFTLDAGPNVHVIYPKENEKQVVSFLHDRMKGQVKRIIFDNLGNGPEQLTIEDN